jgi:hypothetical protein
VIAAPLSSTVAMEGLLLGNVKQRRPCGGRGPSFAGVVDPRTKSGSRLRGNDGDRRQYASTSPAKPSSSAGVTISP